jgi:hypothetical protein
MQRRRRMRRRMKRMRTKNVHGLISLDATIWLMFVCGFNAMFLYWRKNNECENENDDFQDDRGNLMLKSEVL